MGYPDRVVGVPDQLELMKKLTYLIDGEMVLKYQVVSEDLDTLVSVKSEVDLRHMIDEINLYELAGSPRLRAFLFPVKHCSQVSPASSSPRSAASHTSDAMNYTINMLKAQSSPSICGMNTIMYAPQQINSHNYVYQLHPQYNNYQRVDPQRNGGPERLVSVGPVGPGDGMRHHVDPVSEHYYNGARQNHGGRCYSQCMHGNRRSIEKTWGMSSVPSSPRY
ncbi:hypothetical protein CASFOL_018015 [Castilleja foliolosa]|uniref:PB1 domain-containing protein n=1 Tax=Castilleja foliolosa TaxID=1961234 RepID=A0ABD3D758_9LAMI